MTNRDLDYPTAGPAMRGMSDNSNGPVHRFRPKSAVDMIPFVLAIGTIFYLYIGLSDGQLFNEDYAVYLQQAWNIANHVPMSDMGVINYFDPTRPLLMNGPLTFPTLLPLIYAYPVSIFGFDLQIFKNDSDRSLAERAFTVLLCDEKGGVCNSRGIIFDTSFYIIL
jgi:hypothetical protein